MPFGLIISFACHVTLLAWAFWSMRAVHELPPPDTPSISAEIITPSEFLRLKQGAEDAKHLETKAKEKPTTDDSKNEAKKPADTPPPPPPPQEVAKVEPPPPPEPPKVEPPPPPEPVKPPEPDPIANKIEEPPPPPPPTPGPTPEEQKLLEQKIDDQRKADEAKKAAEDEAKKKAEEEAKKKAAAEALKKKLADERAKKKLAEEKKKADEAKKALDTNKLTALLNKLPDDAPPKALLDKDPAKKGQQAAGSSQTANAVGKEAGTVTGHDTVLSAREQDLLKGMIKSQLYRCAKMPGGGGGLDTPVVTVEWKLNQDGSIEGEPVVLQPQNTPLFQIAASASVNAIKNCSPLQLPPDKYGAWSKITWDFDWPHILGLR